MALVSFFVFSCPLLQPVIIATKIAAVNPVRIRDDTLFFIIKFSPFV